MKTNFKLFSIVWFGILLISVLYVFVIFSMNDYIKTESNRLEENASVPHTVGQPYLELFKLQEAVTKFYTQPTRFSKDQLLFRFDIYWSRIPLLVETEEAQFILDIKNIHPNIRKLYGSLVKLEDKMISLTPKSKKIYLEIIAELDMHQFILKSIYIEGNELIRKMAVNGIQHHNKLNLLVIFSLVFGWFIFIFTFILFAKQYKKNTTLSNKLQKHTYQLEKTIDERTKQLQCTNKKLEQLSIKDHLTDLYNRRYFDKAIKTEVSRALRYNKKLSLLMCDIDHFKSLNDYFGHQEGDECLRELSKLISDQCGRSTDAIVRYGGDEIVVLLPETSLASALITAQKIGNSIWYSKRKVAPENPLQRQTISIGIAELQNSHSKNEFDLLALADQHLFASKEKGRNRASCSIKSIPFPKN